MATTPETGAAPDGRRAKISASGVDVFYGAKHAIRNVSIDIGERQVVAFIGPSGCGKSTFLRCINRMNDTIPGARVEGRIEIDGENVNDRSVDPVILRAKVGMVFQKPNPFPKTIFENVAFGLRLMGVKGSELEDRVVEALKDRKSVV